MKACKTCKTETTFVGEDSYWIQRGMRELYFYKEVKTQGSGNCNLPLVKKAKLMGVVLT